MISDKGKRKIQYGKQTYYWWVRKNSDGHPRIHIISEDKSIYFEKAFDKEIGIGTGYIESLIRAYEEKKEQK